MRLEEVRNDTRTPAEAPKSRRLYEPPGISWSEDTEIRANLISACGKHGAAGTCEPSHGGNNS
jgi:hypothetical protein